MLDDAGIRLAILDTGFFKVPVPESPDKLRAQWDLLDRAFERADSLGTDLIRTFAFTYRRNETPDPDAYPRIYDLVAESAERAGRAGFRLAVENVNPSYVERSSQSANLLQARSATCVSASPVPTWSISSKTLLHESSRCPPSA